ncbi:MAG: hypothetical protein KAJ98_10245 [Spirochaetaceae bacterium]|nr:hypothetical protein [Spirochaetaceae bacterium]
MSQITIRNLDPLVEKIIRQKAKNGHESLSETVNLLLKQAIGLDGPTGKKRNLQHLAGSWSNEAADEFEKTQIPFNVIDDELWK